MVNKFDILYFLCTQFEYSLSRNLSLCLQCWTWVHLSLNIKQDSIRLISIELLLLSSAWITYYFCRVQDALPSCARTESYLVLSHLFSSWGNFGTLITQRPPLTWFMMMLSLSEPSDDSPPISGYWNSDPNQSEIESLWSLMTAIPGFPLILTILLCSTLDSGACTKLFKYIQSLDSGYYTLNTFCLICFWDLRRSGYLWILTFAFGYSFCSCLGWTRGFCYS